ncbi:MAG: hypothetical protein GVY09_03120 [Gammaproteobacteria bacterium]|jgi:uncharacterized protein involved in response to NO|nr:hypothetical protein [Gammaproteobacteria bacterium]
MVSAFSVLLAYGFRPFFLLAAGYAVLPMLLWSGFLLGLWGVPVDGDPFAWHMHEMVFGFGGAALAGFLLTAVPEFTDSKPVTSWRLAVLVLCWIAARLAVWNAASLGPWPAAVLGLLFLGWLIALVAPPLWTRAAGRHRALVYGLAALGLAVLAVMTIAGQIHTGRELADTWPIRLAFVAVVLAALARALPIALASGAYDAIAYGLSGLLWSLGFGLYLAAIGPMLLAPRADE